ncbi:MAG: hypothetical protein A2233_05535 [Candidatus Kerfeldbacteria bacterium RIFOXYA2_FULL_38_24]|uniref:Major facilitator superfamily (MFS) profile domain-containing protein n=1 Tax=Candidatus Kerfeldbacteria bacterium RIFOXYB2_FULL_38_14 TaxID=1798547 RepID=A0A1G2BGD6_9BACT|nr:MAG: hypothetical protein A2233_05535 [Candidatus Kerfeldbacteria bacterium RIFOXYA2_FULL_38_24]OGY88288.1 MAG: hypothetical protein A2319_03820 [Candidatus Kerfeldbacteria bacterium RIFOXYB2_FULL_38_14]
MFKIVRSDIKSLPKPALLMIVAMSLYTFGWGFADPFFSLYLDTFASDYALVGLFQTILNVVAVVLLFPVGAILDRANHYPLLIGAKIGYVFVVLLYFCAGLFNSLPLLIIALILNGFLMPFVWAGTMATLQDYANQKNASLIFGLYTTSYNFLWIIGLAFSLVLVAHLPIYYIFLPIVIFLIASAWCHQGQQDKHAESLKTTLKDVVIKDKLFLRMLQEMKYFNIEMWLMYLFSFLMVTVSILTFTFLPLYATDKGFSIPQVGLLVLIITLPSIFSFVVVEIANRYERLRNIIFGALISAIAALMFFILKPTGIEIFLCGFLLSLGYAIALPSLNAVITVLTPKQYTGTGSALINIAWFASVMIFAPIIGFLLDRFGWHFTYAIMGVFYFLLTVMMMVIRFHFKKRNLLYHANHPHSSHHPYIL